MARPPAVAGQFYEGTKSGLVQEIEQCFLGELGPGKLPEVRPQRVGSVLGLVCPHAGYHYSGSAAAHAYAALAADGIPDVAVLLGPNHYGLGPAVAVSPEDAWATPLGSLRADAETAETILKLSRYAEADELPHMKEHSIEVQLPFLQYIGRDSTRIVPISIAHLDRSDALALVEDLGHAIAEAVSGRSAVVIASTDFTHYESHSVAQTRDALAMEPIVAMDPQGLIEVVYSKDITMCGVIGVAVMLEACKRLGAVNARKLTYYTSGDVSGDRSQVVGYGSLSIELPT
jgi:MEMO1 family protein